MTIPDAGESATAADIIEMLDHVRTHAGYAGVSALLTGIPSSALTDTDRGEITRAMVRAVARIWPSRSEGEP